MNNIKEFKKKKNIELKKNQLVYIGKDNFIHPVNIKQKWKT